MANSEDDYERTKELKRFHDSKTGVKGLIDSGLLSSIPRFFVHTPETRKDLNSSSSSSPSPISVPTVDLSGAQSNRRSAIVEEISRAARELGIFQIVNHGIQSAILDRTIAAIKAFHQQPPEIRSRFYRRDWGTGVSYLPNNDQYLSEDATWRDTLQLRLGPTPPAPEQVPEVCRDAVAEWDRQVVRLGGVVMDLLGEGLGLGAGRFREMSCLEGRVMTGHYYPYCPEPDLTVGLASHTDPKLLTVLLQDHMGGLQIKVGEEWVHVKPIPGAIVINVGDLLQIMSNDEYKSIEHRVLANSSREPRVSVGVFFNPTEREKLFGPLPELISPEKPAAYRHFTYPEFMQKFFTKDLVGKSPKNYFRL